MAKAFPFEFITFLIGLSFALFYFHTVNSMSENAYVQLRQNPLFDLIKLFKIEIILTVIAWIVFIKNFSKKRRFFHFNQRSIPLGSNINPFISAFYP